MMRIFPPQPPVPDLVDDPMELHVGGDPPGHPPGGGAQVPVPGGLGDTDYSTILPIPPHPHFPTPSSMRPPSRHNVSQTPHPEDVSKAKSRTATPVAGPAYGAKGRWVDVDWRFSAPHTEPGSSSSGPAAVPGLPVTGEGCPIQQNIYPRTHPGTACSS